MEKKVKKGLVFYADILGYLNIIKNNDIELCASLINDIILQLDRSVISKIISSDPKYSEINTDIQSILQERVTNIIVSDTIVIFFDLDNLTSKDKTYIFGIISLYVIFLFGDTFEKGISVRASLEYGPFYFKDNIFAGKAISDGYMNTMDMDFSGILVSKDADAYIQRELLDLLYDKKFYNERYIPILGNYKSGEKKEVLINWIDNDIFKNDIRQTIFESFNMHKKDITDSVMRKIENTERIIRCFLYCSKINGQNNADKKEAT